MELTTWNIPLFSSDGRGSNRVAKNKQTSQYSGYSKVFLPDKYTKVAVLVCAVHNWSPLLYGCGKGELDKAKWGKDNL